MGMGHACMPALTAFLLLAGMLPAKAALLQDKGATQFIQSAGISSFSSAFDANGRLKRASIFSKISPDILVGHGLIGEVSITSADAAHPHCQGRGFGHDVVGHGGAASAPVSGMTEPASSRYRPWQAAGATWPAPA
jgi:hypothetical protein